MPGHERTGPLSVVRIARAVHGSRRHVEPAPLLQPLLDVRVEVLEYRLAENGRQEQGALPRVRISGIVMNPLGADGELPDPSIERRDQELTRGPGIPFALVA